MVLQRCDQGIGLVRMPRGGRHRGLSVRGCGWYGKLVL